MPKYPTTRMCDGALLEAFEPSVRDSDVFCATAAKSGQTWLMALMHHLRTRGLDPDMGGGHSFSVMPWLELPFDIGGTGEPWEHGARLAQLEALPDPRIFKMHVTYGEVPRPPGSSSRLVTVTRDPRDLPYSMYCHLQGMGKLESEDESFDAYFERWMDFGYFYAFVRSFWPHRGEAQLLWLRYEDMQADLRGTAVQLAQWLGWPVDEAELDRIIPLVSMSNMQSREQRQRSASKRPSLWKEGARFFREGAVGRNREKLSPAQAQRIVDRARAEFEPACFDFVMSQGA